jgi:hypothetical protein
MSTQEENAKLRMEVTQLEAAMREKGAQASLTESKLAAAEAQSKIALAEAQVCWCTYRLCACVEAVCSLTICVLV